MAKKLRVTSLELDAADDGSPKVVTEAEQVLLAEFLSRSPRVIHVSTTGDDTAGNGSVGYPYATIKKAFAIITAGSSGTAWEIVVGPGAHTWEIATGDVSAVAEDGEFPELITYYQIGGSRKVSMRGEPGSVVTISVGAGFTDVNLYLALYAIRGLNFVAVTGTPRLLIGNRTNTELVQVSECVFSISNTAGNGVFQIASSHANSFLRACRFAKTGANAVGLSVSVAAVSGCSVALDGAVTLGASGEVSGNVVTSAGSGSLSGRMITGNVVTSSGAWNLTGSGTSDGLVSGNTVTGSGQVSLTGYTVSGNTVSGTGVSVSSATNIVGNNLYESGSGSQSTRGLITCHATAKTLIVGNTIVSDEAFAEIVDGGRVMIVDRIDGTGDLEMRGNTIIAKCIVLFNSHPSLDANRSSTDRKTTLVGNFIQVTRAATTGTTDVHCAWVDYTRGTIHSQGNTFRALLSASTRTDAHHACVFFHPQTTAGTQVVRSINDWFEVTLPAGSVTVGGTSTDEKSAIAFFDGSEDRLDAVLVNPSISVDGNEEHVFAGLGDPKVVVVGVISCNAAVTYQGTAPAGGYQVMRGGLALSGALTAGGNVTGANLSGTNTGDQSGANPSASVGLSAVNGAASTFLRSDGAPALSQSIVPTWTGIHKHTNVLEVETGSTFGDAGLVIDQDDQDQPVMKIEGTSGSPSDPATLTGTDEVGDGMTAAGPWSGPDGYSWAGMMMVKINGTNYSVPFYSYQAP